ncbi:MAG TPA: T9SS type A sorting domain-containing protein, partial [Candidatus Kapabacteria bacterium]|nr:T9SS type A sorting domain-containing protein [Candidatus Kapabacteria bacterium]
SLAQAQPPRIDSMRIDESKGLLSLYGDFGSVQGKVWCDSIELTIISWSNSIIVSSIPIDGKGSAGPVIVESDGIRSNIRLISMWECSFDKNASQYHTQGSTIDYEHVSSLFRFRLDIQSLLIHNSIPKKIDFQTFYSRIIHTYMGDRYHFTEIDTNKKTGCLFVFSKEINFNLLVSSTITVSGDTLNYFRTLLDSSLQILTYGDGPIDNTGHIQIANRSSGIAYFLPEVNILAVPIKDKLTPVISVFPNPCSRNFCVNVFGINPREFQCLLYDVNGNLVKQFPLGLFVYDVSTVAASNYILKIITGSQSYSTIVSIIK